MFYKKRVQRPDTAADIAERLKCKTAEAQVRAERASRFPVITAENFEEANAWQETRLAELAR